MPNPNERTYDADKLTSLAPTNIVWARTWVRHWLGDRPDLRTGLPGAGSTELGIWQQGSKSDVELNALLALDAVPVTVTDGLTISVVPAYRPHFTAGHIYLGDPNLWRTRSVDGTSETRRDPMQIVAAWLNQGRSFDALLPLPLPPFEEVRATALRDGSGGVSLAPGTPIVVSGL